MKYILNKEVRPFSKGQEFDEQYDYFGLFLALGWLDEVKETKSVWDLENGDKYYVVFSDLEISTEYIWDGDGVDLTYRNGGEVFLTRESAERELEIRKRMAKDAKEGLGLHKDIEITRASGDSAGPGY